MQQTNTQDENPLMSFIITDYNLTGEMLKQCIESILSLSLRPHEREIILVDDGSDGVTISELLDYRDQIIYIRQPNGGLSEARNIGIRCSRGRFLQFIDGDDYLIQTAYEHCLDFVRYHNDVGIVLFELTNKEAKQETFKDEEFNTGSEFMHNRNLRASACGYILNRKTLADLRFTSGTLHEDEEFTPQLFLRAENVVSTTAKAYFYRKREASIVHDDDTRSVIRRLNDTEKILFHLNTLSGEVPSYDSLALRRRVHQLTMDYIYNIIVQTRSEQQLERRIERLKKRGLFPLPDRNYTQKYKWFRKITSTKAGRRLLLRTLPLIKKK